MKSSAKSDFLSNKIRKKQCLKKYVFAIVGSLWNVGSEMRSILETGDLPIKKLVLMDLSQNAGKKFAGVTRISL
ncbi:hypothetical protein OAK48_02610 [Deltaproteobacteria bacterium]|nr:hypothetical protein [Deltaproteobacteria bacterium]